MTDQEINAAIAEACGWSQVECREHPLDPQLKVLSGYPAGVKHLRAVPNYYEDLNAMHEAEKTAIETGMFKRFQFGNRLMDILWRDNKEEYTASANFCFMHASARQRAEAFLKTIGKWTE